MKCTLEAQFVIWFDTTGERITVGDDQDGLDMTEIQFVRDDGTKGDAIRFGDEQVPMLIEALQRFMAFKKERSMPTSRAAGEESNG